MEQVGRYLKKSRKEKKIKLSAISKNLNISSEIIKNIEEDSFEGDIDKAYLTGHVRSYAKYLNLDENEVIERFKVQTSFIKEKDIQNLPKPLDSNIFTKFSTGISFFSIVFISLAFYFLFVKSIDTQHDYSMIPDLPENLKSEVEEFEIELAFKEIEKNKKILQRNLSSNLEFNEMNANNIPSKSSAIASFSNKEEEALISKQITLKFLNPTWIQLRNFQDEIVFSKLMSKKDEFSYSVLDQFQLTAGNAGNILVLINGKTRGKLGKKGEVIESVIIDSEFNN